MILADQYNKVGNLEINPNPDGNLVKDRGAILNQWGKIDYSTNDIRTTGKLPF